MEGCASLTSTLSLVSCSPQRRLGLRLEPDVPLVGFIGRLTEQKGVDLILSAVAALLSPPLPPLPLPVGNQLARFYVAALITCLDVGSLQRHSVCLQLLDLSSPRAACKTMTHELASISPVFAVSDRCDGGGAAAADAAGAAGHR